jgi:hypothetical protein
MRELATADLPETEVFTAPSARETVLRLTEKKYDILPETYSETHAGYMALTQAVKKATATQSTKSLDLFR